MVSVRLIADIYMRSPSKSAGNIANAWLENNIESCLLHSKRYAKVGLSKMQQILNTIYITVNAMHIESNYLVFVKTVEERH